MSDPFKDVFGFDFGFKRAEVPAAKKCSSARELADWFKSFALACRDNLPRNTDAS